MAAIVLLCLLLVVVMAGAARGSSSCDRECVERVKARQFSERYGGCRSMRCVYRVRAKREARQMARFKRNPMPRCTWHGESGAHLGEWAAARYRAKNPTSTAGGKFQVIDSTWYANGGRRYNVRHPAAAAPKVEQEKVARRVLRSQGLGAWVLC